MTVTFTSIENLATWLKRAKDAHHGQPDETWVPFYAMYMAMRLRAIPEHQAIEYAKDYARHFEESKALLIE